MKSLRSFGPQGLLCHYPKHAIAGLIAAIWLTWFGYMTVQALWSVFATYWPISVTMMLGSFVAGSTAAGGGAVAFPVMTLVLGFDPASARDFSLMIQSVGMTTATAFILLMRISICWRVIRICAAGGAIGFAAGLSFVAPLLDFDYIKLLFASLWLGFAGALYLTTKRHGDFQETEAAAGAGFLFLMGVVGGVITSLFGSGIDMWIFAAITLLLRMDLKIATSTSVVLMAVLSVFGFAWKLAFGGGMAEAAWQAWYSAIPIVAVGAPLGALVLSRISRRALTVALLGLIVFQYLGTVVIVSDEAQLLVVGLLLGAGFSAGSALLFGGAQAGRLCGAKAGVTAPPARSWDHRAIGRGARPGAAHFTH